MNARDRIEVGALALIIGVVIPAPSPPLPPREVRMPIEQVEHLPPDVALDVLQELSDGPAD